MNADLDSRIATLPGEKVTLDYIKSRIRSVDFMVLPGSTVTLCNITLDNGYSVRGESACVDPAGFDQDVGEQLAQKQAIDKLWPLFGFLLAEDRFRRRQ